MSAVRAVRAVRALLRLERRELQRHRGRSLLLLLLVAVPVAAVVGGTSLVQITTPTDEERRASAMGQADLRIETPFRFEERAEVLAQLPTQARVQSYREGGELVRAAGRQLQATARIVGPSSVDGDAIGLARGAFRVERGRMPANAGEVALSPVLLDGLGCDIGDQVTLEYGARRTITAVVVDPAALKIPLVVRRAAAVEHQGQGYFLVDVDGDGDRRDDDEVASLASRLRAAGVDILERNEVSGEGGELAWAVFVLGSIGFLEAGLIVAATFIVGLRRRQYEIGLLGSTGATRGTLTSSLVVSAGALAAVGALVGAAVGVAMGAAVRPFLDAWNGRDNGPFELAWGTLIAAIVLGVVVAVAATVLPSRAAAKMPIRQALGARRPIEARSTRWLMLGVSTIALGLIAVLLAPRDSAILGALAAIAGSFLGVLGFGICSPYILGAVGRHVGDLPLRWRLAVRDAGRFRARNGPVVTAVVAGMSMSVTVAVLVASLSAAIDRLPSMHRTDQLEVAGAESEQVAEEILRSMGGIAAAPLEAAYLNGEPIRAVRADDPIPNPSRQWIAVGDEDLLQAIGAESGRDALLRGELLQLQTPQGGLLDMLGIAPESEDHSVSLSTWRDGGALSPLTVTVVELDQNVMSPAFVLHRAKAEQLGWQSGPPIDRSVAPWKVRLDRTVSRSDLDRAGTFAAAAIGVSLDAQRLRQSPARGFYYAVQWLCILTGLVIVLVATALSGVESAADARILQTVGAAPKLLRGHEAARAGYLAFLGCVLALPAGMIPAVVLFKASNLPLPLVVPWFDLAVAALALPLLAYAVAWLTHRDRTRTSWWPPRTALLLVVLLLSGGRAMADASRIEWEPFVGEAFDGSPLEGQLGRLRVPEQHQHPTGASIEIAFVRYRTDHPNPGPPVVFLAGGPGGSGVALAAVVASHPQMRFLEQADVIGIDQRGTGLSLPNLETPAGLLPSLPLDRAPSREEVVAGLRRNARTLVRYWQRRGVMPAAYNTRESADDIDRVLEAMGLDQVVLYGSSYGSHLGLAYLNRHPERVARALLSKVEGPNHTMKLPRTVQDRLDELAQRCRDDTRCHASLPDLTASVDALLSTLRTTPVRVQIEDQTEIVVGAFDLQTYLSNALSFANSTAEIPGQLLAFAAGDWSSLVDSARASRALELSLMPLVMDCASGATTERLDEIRRQTRDPRLPLGDAILAPHYPAVCTACPDCDLGDGFRAIATVDVPLMFVSGSLDVRTPRSNVDEIIGSFPSAAHVRIERAGHESRELMSPEYRALFQAFVRGEPPRDTTITLPSVPLALQTAETDGSILDP